MLIMSRHVLLLVVNLIQCLPLVVKSSSLALLFLCTVVLLSISVGLVMNLLRATSYRLELVLSVPCIPFD